MYSQAEKQRITVVMIISVYVIWERKKKRAREDSQILYAILARSACHSSHQWQARLHISTSLTGVGQVQPWGWGLAVGTPLLGEIGGIEHAWPKGAGTAPIVSLFLERQLKD